LDLGLVRHIRDSVEEFADSQAKADHKSGDEIEKELFEKIRATSLIFASPEEVASLAADVASPLASATHGSSLLR
jgi:hypothetical protein